MPAIHQALANLSGYELRKKHLACAGPIYQETHFIFQCCGCDKHSAAAVLQQCTDTGNVPEALRLAHLIGAAVKTGESGRRA